MLWRAVVWQAVTDLMNPNRVYDDEIMAWVDSSDFELICAYASINSELLAKAMKLMSSANRERRVEIGRNLRMNILDRREQIENDT